MRGMFENVTLDLFKSEIIKNRISNIKRFLTLALLEVLSVTTGTLIHKPYTYFFGDLLV